MWSLYFHSSCMRDQFSSLFWENVYFSCSALGYKFCLSFNGKQFKIKVTTSGIQSYIFLEFAWVYVGSKHHMLCGSVNVILKMVLLWYNNLFSLLWCTKICWQIYTPPVPKYKAPKD
jgi:hypothetical protein